MLEDDDELENEPKEPRNDAITTQPDNEFVQGAGGGAL